MSNKPRAVFIKSGDSECHQGRWETIIDIVEDLDEDGSNQVVILGNHQGIQGVHIIRETDVEISWLCEEGITYWELVDE